MLNICVKKSFNFQNQKLFNYKIIDDKKTTLSNIKDFALEDFELSIG
jgi:hypothetical protein